MGTPRTRSRTMRTYSPGSYQPGYYSGSGWVNLGSPVSGSTLDNISEYCSDTLGPGPPYTEPHGLLIEWKKVISPLMLSGEEGHGFSWRRLSNYNPTNFSHYSYVTSTTATDWNYWKAKALASINPFRPQLDLPLFLFELREFPRMLRGLGDVLRGRAKPKDVPGGYLAYNFGWAPLISDLSTLFNFAESIAKTRNALTNAANGARVSHKLGDKTQNYLPTTIAYALGGAGTYSLYVSEKTTVTAWCCARVHLLEPLPLLAYDREMQAIRIALGLNLRAATLWDAIPWTWLIDYFTNIGDLIEARNGYTMWNFKDLYVMVRTAYTKKVTGAVNSVGSMSFSGGEMSFIRKERSYQGSDPNVGFGRAPFLTDFQAGILGSLLTATALRGR